MAGEEIGEAGRRERFARWEQLGLDLVKQDLLNGGHRVVGGPPAVQALAWEWVKMKEEHSDARFDVQTAALQLLKEIDQATNGSSAPIVLEQLKGLEMTGEQAKKAFLYLKSKGLIEANFKIFYAARLSAAGHDVVDEIRRPETPEASDEIVKALGIRRDVMTDLGLPGHTVAEQLGVSTAMTQANSPPSYSRQTIISAADMLKALGHSGFNRFLMELELPDSTAGQGSGLLARATSLADFAIKNPESLSPERRTISYEIILRAIQLWKDGVTTNLNSGEREKFAAAMQREGLSARLEKIDQDEETSFFNQTSGKSEEAMPTQPLIRKSSLPRRVFIVHGHDDAARLAVARFLERLEFDVTILHEQANKGRTIIEKFEDHSDVGFVVVLLTPDDVGGKASAAQQQRARQNVILEWGYFIGRLGRPRVCALKKGDLELPSDILGVVWEVFDEHEAWKHKLAKELAAAGFVVDWAKVAL